MRGVAVDGRRGCAIVGDDQIALKGEQKSAVFGVAMARLARGVQGRR